METKIYSDFSWMLSRLVAHVLALSPVLYLWYWVTGSACFTSVFIVGLLLVYVTLLYAQVKMPLLKIGNKKIELNNFFHKGSTEFSVADLKDIKQDRRSIYLIFEGSVVKVNLCGMRKHRADEALRDIYHALIPRKMP